MFKFGPEGTLAFLIAIAILLGVAKLLGELAKKIGQPAVLGELFGGILLGPTVLGSFYPDIFTSLFRPDNGASVALDGLLLLSSLFLLLVVGFEVNLQTLRQERRPVLTIGFFGILIPYAMGAALGWYGHKFIAPELPRLVLALLLAAAMSISALPVIARILMDLHLLRTRIGGMIIGIATLNDFVGWLLFTIVLGMSGNTQAGMELLGITVVRLMVIIAAILIAPPLIRYAASKLGRFFKNEWVAIGALLFAAVLFGAGMEWLGVHAIFGAFLVGLIVTAAGVLGTNVRRTIEKLTINFFAPLFFGAVGLKINFISDFNFLIVAAILIVAIVSKMLSAWIGGWLVRLPGRERIAIGLGITARGGMGIILATVALDHGIVSPAVFEGLAIMAVGTSMLSVLMKPVLAKQPASERSLPVVPDSNLPA